MAMAANCASCYSMAVLTSPTFLQQSVRRRVRFRLALADSVHVRAANSMCIAHLLGQNFFTGENKWKQGRSSLPGCMHMHRPSWTKHLESYECRQRIESKYSTESSDAPDYSSAPIDVMADVKTEKIIVLGGSGFVGSAICKAAVARGIEVVSLSRSGRPSFMDPWVEQVTWVPGDVFYVDWDGLFGSATPVTAVVSTIGGFGTNEQMEKINGDANVLAVDAASKAGIPKFVYISVHDYNIPSFFLSSGYFTGKRRAEAEVLSKYPNSGTVLRPAFIYGKRKALGLDIPLDLIGQPLEKFLLANENLIRPLSYLPASELVLAPPISVEDVAGAVVKAVIDDSVFGVFTIEQIREASATLRS